MNPRVISVRALPGFKLELDFNNGERRLFDARSHIERTPALHRLQNPLFFVNAQVAHGTVAWSEDEDFCPETLYLDSQPITLTKAA